MFPEILHYEQTHSFISWMSTRMNETIFEVYAEHLLVLTHEQYFNIRQEDMIKMSSGPTSPSSGPTTPITPLTSHTSGSKKRQAFLSQHDDLIDELVLNLLKKPYLTNMSLILPHLHPFNLLSILLNLKNLPGFLSLITSGERLLMKFRSSPLKITRWLKWLTLTNTQHLVALNPNHSLLWVSPILSPSNLTFMTIILHLITHLKPWISHVISVTPPEPWIVWMNQVH